VSFHDWLGVAAGAALALSSGWAVRREWRRPTYTAARKAPSSWLWGEGLWRAVLRTMVRDVVAIGCLAVLVPTLSYSADTSSSAGVFLGVVGVVVLIVLLTTAFCAMSIALVNWPKGLVPPVMRADRGLLQSAVARSGKARLK